MHAGTVRIGLLVCLAFAVAFVAVRAFEFTALRVRWDLNAYGSLVWALLGLHTLHLVTDLVDTAVLAFFTFVAPVDERRFVDVADNASYWYFVVASWIPIWAVLYLFPRVA